MADTLTVSKPASAEITDPDLHRQVNALRRTDNLTNWFYLAREYLYLATVLGAVLALYHFHDAWGVSRGWLIPATALAVVLVGIGQHRLVMLAHEASHYALFRN